jgi:nucleoside-diphosphate-sugar epimerase
LTTEKIFVTGGTGFLGAYILQELVHRGFHVRALRRSHQLPFFIDPQVFEKIEWIDGDVLDVVVLDEALKDIGVVIHSAAIVSFNKSDRKQMNKVNVEGTQNVVNVSIKNKIKRFIHISSVAALGRTAKGDIVTEEKTWEESKINTNYAISKHHAEMEVWRGFAEGLGGVIINPSTILGYGNWHNSSCAIFKNVYKEFPWYTNGINGFVGVEDVAKITAEMVLSQINEQRFIINTDNWSFKKLLSEIADGFKKRRPYREATSFMGEIAWRLEHMKHLFTDGKPLLSRESARVAQSKTYFSNESILNALPHFSFTPLEEVIKESCEKYGKAIQKGLLTL